MIIRLWWKEWRALAPIAVTVLLAGIALHWFLLAHGGRDVRNGVLVPIAMSWAVLYAFVAGSASFAGERENRTLGFLDALPVGRGSLWAGKATFALSSSLVLALLLRWIGLAGWRYEVGGPLRLMNLEPFFVSLLVEATIWSFFWSALSKTAILAAILALLTTLFASIVDYRFLAPGFQDGSLAHPLSAPKVTGLLAVLLFSWFVVQLESRWK